MMHSGTSLRFPAVLLVLALAALGCATTSVQPTVTLIPTFGPPTETEIPTATATPPPVPEGWSRITLDDGSASIALPPGWVVLKQGTDETTAAVEQVRATYPDVAAVIDAQLQLAVDQNIGLEAFDLGEEALARGYATNVNIIREEFDFEFTIDEFAETNRKTLAETVGDDAITEERLVIAGKRGGVFIYGANVQITDTINRDLGIVQYFLLNNPRSVHMITFGCPYDVLDAGKLLFDDIIETLVLQQ